MLESLIAKEDLPGVLGAKKASPTVFYQSFRTAFKPLFEIQEPLSRLSGRKLAQHYGGALLALTRQCSTELSRSLAEDWAEAILSIMHQAVQLLSKLESHVCEDGQEVLRLYCQLIARCNEKNLYERVIEYSAGLMRIFDARTFLDKETLYLKANLLISRANAFLQSNSKTQESLDEVYTLVTTHSEEVLDQLSKQALNSLDHTSIAKSYTNMFRLLYNCGRCLDSLASGDLEVHAQALATRQKALLYLAKTKPDLGNFFSFAYSSMQATYRIATSHQSGKLFGSLASAVSECFNLVDHSGYAKYLDKNCCSIVELQVFTLQKLHKYQEARQMLDQVIIREAVDSASVSYQNAKFLLDYARLTHQLELSPVATLLQAIHWLERAQVCRTTEDVGKFRKAACLELESWVKTTYSIISATALETGELPDYSFMSALDGLLRCYGHIGPLDLALYFYVRTAVSLVLYLSSRDSKWQREALESLRKLFQSQCERFLSCVYNLALIFAHKGEKQIAVSFIEETTGYLSQSCEKCSTVHMCILDMWSRALSPTVADLRSAQLVLGCYVEKQLTLASLHELPSDNWDKIVDINHRLNRSLVEASESGVDIPIPEDCLLYSRLHTHLHCYEERVRLAERELANCKRSLVRCASTSNAHILHAFRKQTESLVIYLAGELRTSSRRQLARVLLEYIEIVAACPAVFTEEKVLGVLLNVQIKGTLVEGLAQAVERIIDLEPLPDAQVWKAVLLLERVKQAESHNPHTVWLSAEVENSYVRAVVCLQGALQSWAGLFQCQMLDFSPGNYQILKKKAKPTLAQMEINETIRSLLLCADICTLLELHKMAAFAFELVKKLLNMQEVSPDTEVRKVLIRLRLAQSLYNLGFTALAADVSKLVSVFDPILSDFPREYGDLEYSHMWVALLQAERLFLACDFLRSGKKCEAVFQGLLPGSSTKREQVLRGKCCWLKASLSLTHCDYAQALKWVNEGRRCLQETSISTIGLQNLSLLTSIKDNCYMKLRDRESGPSLQRTALFPWSSWAHQTLSVQLLDVLTEIYLAQGLVSTCIGLLAAGLRLGRMLGSASLLLGFATRKVTMERQMTTDPRLDCANIVMEKNDGLTLAKDYLIAISRSLFGALLAQAKAQVTPTSITTHDLIHVSDEALIVLSPLDVSLLGHFFSPYRLIQSLVTVGDLTVSQEFSEMLEELHLSDQNFYKIARAALNPHLQGLHYQCLRSLIFKRQASMLARKKKTKECLELLGRSILELGCCEDFLSALVSGKKCCSGFELNPHLMDDLASAAVIYADLMVKSRLEEEGYGMLRQLGSAVGIRSVSAQRQIGYLLARNPVSDPWTRAFFAMRSIGVTYQHQLQAKGLPNSLHSLDSFISTCREIDPKWTVVGLTIGRGVLGEGLVLTRVTADKDPLTFLLSSRCKTCSFEHSLSDQLEEFAKIMRDSGHSIASKLGATKWWQQREALDSRLETWLSSLQTHFLGPLVCLLMGKLMDEDISRYIEAETRDFSEVKNCRECGQPWGGGLVHCLLTAAAANVLSNEEIKNIVEAVGLSKPQVMKKVRNLRKEVGGKVLNRYPVVLVVDGSLLYLPWESIPALAGQVVTRVPAFQFLAQRLNLPAWQPDSGFYILNPSKDLDNTQSTFQAYLSSKETWTGLIATAPTEQDFKHNLESKDLLLYCGHSSGEQYIRGDSVKDLTIRAVTLLIGCSSGMLRPLGQYEPQGIAVQYLIGGCPALVANLWDVTDKDIDRFAMEVLRRLGEGEELASAVAQSRHVCKLKRLIGAAPVVYGVPIRQSTK